MGASLNRWLSRSPQAVDSEEQSVPVCLPHSSRNSERHGANCEVGLVSAQWVLDFPESLKLFVGWLMFGVSPRVPSESSLLNSVLLLADRIMVPGHCMDCVYGIVSCSLYLRSSQSLVQYRTYVKTSSSSQTLRGPYSLLTFNNKTLLPVHRSAKCVWHVSLCSLVGGECHGHRCGPRTHIFFLTNSTPWNGTTH